MAQQTRHRLRIRRLINPYTSAKAIMAAGLVEASKTREWIVQ